MAAVLAGLLAPLPAMAQYGQPYQQQQQPYQQQPPTTVRLPIFLHVLGGAWIPMTGVFAENHKIGGAVDLMGGLSLEPFLHQGIDLFVDLMLSGQELQKQAVIDADHTRTMMMSGCVGLRWFFFPPAAGMGAPYLLAGAGFVYETAEGNAHHAPPKPSWMTMGGIGWEAPLGPLLRLGARVTGTYLNENGSQLGWVAPSVTVGGQI